MDVDVTSVTSLASTNQMKGVTNAGLNLQREPLQKNAGGNSEKGTAISSLIFTMGVNYDIIVV